MPLNQPDRDALVCGIDDNMFGTPVSNKTSHVSNDCLTANRLHYDTVLPIREITGSLRLRSLNGRKPW